MKKNEIPYFIEMRGCINCDASKSMKERHGNLYGFDHEIMASCLLMGCDNYGINLTHPFIDPEEFVKIVNKKRENLTKENLENSRKYLKEIKQKFGEHYEKLGVSIDNLIKEI